MIRFLVSVKPGIRSVSPWSSFEYNAFDSELQLRSFGIPIVQPAAAYERDHIALARRAAAEK